MNASVWYFDAWIFGRFRELLSGETHLVAKYAGTLYFWMPVFSVAFMLMLHRLEGSWFRRGFFAVATGILAYQLNSLLALVFGRPSPYFFQPQFWTGEALLNPDFAFGFPDWGTGCFFAIMAFCLGSREMRNLRSFFAAFAAAFVFFRLAGAYSFFSGIVLGAVLGILTGKILLILSDKVVNMRA